MPSDGSTAAPLYPYYTYNIISLSPNYAYQIFLDRYRNCVRKSNRASRECRQQFRSPHAVLVGKATLLAIQKVHNLHYLRLNYFDCVLERNNSLKVAPSRFYIPFCREVLNIKRDTTALAARFGITIFLRQALHLNGLVHADD